MTYEEHRAAQLAAQASLAPWDGFVALKRLADWYAAHEGEIQQIARQVTYLAGTFPQEARNEEAPDTDRGVAPD